MRQMGWKKVAALSEEDHKYADYITAVQDLVEKDGLSFVANRNIPNDAKLPLAQVIRFPPPPTPLPIFGVYYYYRVIIEFIMETTAASVGDPDAQDSPC